MRPTAREIVSRLKLKPHPEGGFYRETYRAKGVIPKAALGAGFGGERAHSTAIYCLFPKGAVSRFHRIRSDELWHFYIGGPLTIVELRRSGPPKKTVLGPDLKAGQRPQHAVPAGVWFGAYPNDGTPYCLAGCTVAPGFDFSEFELGSRRELLRVFPRARREVLRLT
ncbi:MAG: cupin domain-containing protein [Elusimicrobia bacterium]|nr:cupin domain-containing protein [Elusimicrobiota bacterium]